MSLFVSPNTTFEATVTGATPGQVGVITVRVEDGQNNVVTAATTSGIVESGTGVYTATLTAPATAGQYLIIWNDSGVETAEVLNPTLSVAPNTSFEATVNGAASGQVGTITVRIEDGQNNIITAPTTSGIVESGTGVYTATLTSPNVVGQYVVIWDDSGEETAEAFWVPYTTIPDWGNHSDAAESLVLDPTSEDAGNVQVSLEDPENGIQVVTQAYPAPERERLTAANADSFGDPYVQGRFRNRTISLVVRCFGDEVTMRARVADLTQKAGKLALYGGTLKRTLNNTDVVVFDVLDCDIDVPADWMFLHARSVNVTLTLLCEPAGRGAEVSFSAASEATLPALVWTMTGVKGDLPGLMRVVVDEQQGVSQQFAQLGLECRNYPGSSAGTTTAHLFYEAEGLTALGGAAGSALSGASGGTVVRMGTLTTLSGAMLGLKTSGGSFLSHVGDFSVWARMYQDAANAGTVSVALEWAQGDYVSTETNEEQTLDTSHRGAFSYVSLGQVHLREATTGAQRWEGRINARSTTAGDAVSVDCVMLVPVSEGYCEARASTALTTPSSWTARDGFDQTAGALTGKTLPVGGTWQGAGDSDDFQVSGSGSVTRTAVSDSGVTVAGGRFVVASGTSAMTTCAAQANFSSPTVNYGQAGLIFRYVDASNFLAVTFGDSGITVHKVIAGTATQIAHKSIAASVTAFTLMASVVASTVRVTMSWTGADDSLGPVHDAELASGGVLESGKVGLLDWYPSASALTRTTDSLFVWEPGVDAAVFASQSLQLGPHNVQREDSGGSVWAEPGEIRGRFPRIPPAGVGGTVRGFLKLSRNTPGEGPDAGIDDVQATVHYTPLYLNVPE